MISTSCFRHRSSNGRSAKRTSAPSRAQTGQAMVEYMVVCAALAFALFVPIQDNPASPDQPRTTWEVVIDGFQNAYRDISYATSLPD